MHLKSSEKFTNNTSDNKIPELGRHFVKNVKQNKETFFNGTKVWCFDRKKTPPPPPCK